MVGICHGVKLPVGQDDNDDGNDDDEQVTREDGGSDMGKFCQRLRWFRTTEG